MTLPGLRHTNSNNGGQMADILHDFSTEVSPDQVFQAVSTPEHLDHWWTKRSRGEAVEGAEYELWFGPDYDWRATVTRCVPGSEFELELIRAEPDWIGTRVGFRFESTRSGTQVRFYHSGWAGPTEHYRVSSYCWALYLRILRRYLEHGETVRYEDRLDV